MKSTIVDRQLPTDSTVEESEAAETIKVLRAELKQSNRERRKLKSSLKSLTDSVLRHLVRLDAEMNKPESPARGKKIAEIANALDLANDEARFHGLDIDCRKDNKDKERARVMRAA